MNVALEGVMLKPSHRGEFIGSVLWHTGSFIKQAFYLMGSTYHCAESNGRSSCAERRPQIQVEHLLLNMLAMAILCRVLATAASLLATSTIVFLM